MVDEAARPLFSVQVDRGMPPAQRQAIGAILTDYGFAGTPVDASLMQFSDSPPWSIELTADASAFFQAIADAAIPLGLSEAGGAAVDTCELGARIGRFLAQLGAVPGRPDGSISLYDTRSRALAAVYHPPMPLPPEAYAALADLPWASFQELPPRIFPDPERRRWVAQRRGADDLDFAWPQPADDAARVARRALVVTALPLEAGAVRAYLSDVRQEQHPWGFSTRGIAAGWEIMLVISGRYNDRAGDITGHAVRDFDPAVALFVGVAGGLKDVEHGDVVVAESVILYQAGKQEDQRFYPRAPSEPADARLLDLARHFAAGAIDHAWSGDGAPRIVVEPIVSGDVVLASTSHADYHALRDHYSQAVAVEQEGFGFLSALRRTPSVRGAVVRGISDLLADKALATTGLSEDERRRRKVEDDERQRTAARHAAAFAIALLAALSPSPRQGAGGGNPVRPSEIARTQTPAESVAHQRPPSVPSPQPPPRPVAAEVLLPNSRRWQDAEAQADAWSDRHRDHRSFPAPLPPKPWLLLHLVPYLPLAPGAPIAHLRELALPHLAPPGQSGDFGAEERDGGLLTLPARARDSASAGFAMLWPTGHLAAALALPPGGADRRTGGLRRIETVALGALERYVGALQALKVPLPIRITITLAEIRGVALVDELASAAPRQSLPTDHYVMPTTLDDWSAAMPDLFRERLDILWRDAGHPNGSASYDEHGTWHPLPSGEAR